ncbi:MAG TPA: hypothetical protein DCY07_04445, partial [Rhodospirillaceae bacterium]|nr:hypothetical protein [Rhodospirillaceae bacterium]
MNLLQRVLFVLLIALAPAMSVAAPYQAGHPPAPARAGLIPTVAAEIGQQFQALVTGEANGEIEPEETFGTRALGVILNSFKLIGSEGSTFVNNFAALPQLATWFNQQVTDPLLRSRWIETGTMLLLVIGAAFAAGWLVDLIFLPLRRKIYQAKWFSSWTRFGGVIGWLGLSLAPVIT